MSLLTEGAVLIERGEHLDLHLVPDLVHELLDADIAPMAKARFLTVQAQQGEKSTELAAFAQALLPHAVDPGFQGAWHGQALFDCCGTGGGGLNILNVSTALLFVLAAADVPVVKHGNRGVTKKSGSADVLEALGLAIELTPEQLRRNLDEIGAAFIFAPAYHPSFKVIAPVRQTLAAQGQRTIFNLLGPLLNPARPATQLIGVFQERHLPLFAEALTQFGRQRPLTVWGTDAENRPLGEVSSLGPNQFQGSVSLPSFPVRPGTTQDLMVTSAQDSARRIVALFQGKETGPVRDIMILNAAVALLVQGRVTSLDQGLAWADEIIQTGRAYQKLQAWQKLSPVR